MKLQNNHEKKLWITVVAGLMSRKGVIVPVAYERADDAVSEFRKRLQEEDQSSDKNLPVLGKKNAQVEQISILDIDEDLLPMFEGKYNWMQYWSGTLDYIEFVGRVKLRITDGKYYEKTEQYILGEAHKYWYSANKPTNIKGINWEGIFSTAYTEISGETSLPKLRDKVMVRDEWKALSNSENDFMTKMLIEWWQENTVSE